MKTTDTVTATNVEQTVCARIPTQEGEFRLCHYTNDRDDKEHLALVFGNVADAHDVLVRVHSECFTGDVLGSLRCDCGPQLQRAMGLIAQAGSGIIIYLRQEGRGIGLAQKLAAYRLQDQGYDTVDANLLLGHGADERDYGIAAAILRDLKVRSIALLTNNPSKIEQLQQLGVEVNKRLPLEAPVTADNADYLATKVQRMRHLLTLPETAPNGSPVPPGSSGLAPYVEDRIDRLRAQASAAYRRRRRPFVTLSYAQSLDGSIATASGEPLRISSPQSMVVTHALRAAHDAILVGIGTVLSDDPRLTVRLTEGDDPQPIVLDSRLRMPTGAQLLAHPKGVWLATACAPSQKSALLCAAGARVIELPTNEDGRIDLPCLLDRLGEEGITSLMVEGGAQVIASFLDQGLANYAVVTVAPAYIGGLHVFDRRRGMGPIPRSSPHLAEVTMTQVGTDMILWGEPVLQDADIETETP